MMRTRKNDLFETVAAGILVAIIVFGILLAGCAAKKPYVIHPGAVDVTDSKMYDSLLIWYGAIQQAKDEFNSGHLPASSKTVINKAGEAYNTMRAIRLSYKAARAAGNTAQADAQAAEWVRLTVEIENLIQQIIRLTIADAGANHGGQVQAFTINGELPEFAFGF